MAQEGFNRVVIFGNLVSDGELHATRAGEAVLRFRVAATETYLDRNSVRQQRTEYVSCVMFGRRTEGVSPLIKKGERVLVEGSLRTSSYEKNGTKAYRTDVVASNVVLAGRGSDDTNPPSPKHRDERAATAPRTAAPDADDFADVPF